MVNVCVLARAKKRSRSLSGGGVDVEEMRGAAPRPARGEPLDPYKGLEHGRDGLHRR